TTERFLSLSARPVARQKPPVFRIAPEKLPTGQPRGIRPQDCGTNRSYAGVPAWRPTQKSSTPETLRPPVRHYRQAEVFPPARAHRVRTAAPAGSPAESSDYPVVPFRHSLTEATC